MNSMRTLLIVFAVVLVWDVAAMLLQMPVLGNLLFIFGLTGFLIIYFRDFDEETASEREKMMRRRWLIVFAVAMFLGLITGSLWNSEIIQPAQHPDAPPAAASGTLPFPTQ